MKCTQVNSYISYQFWKTDTRCKKTQHIFVSNCNTIQTISMFSYLSCNSHSLKSIYPFAANFIAFMGARILQKTFAEIKIMPREVGFQLEISTSGKRAKLLLVMWVRVEIAFRVLENAFFWLHGGSLIFPDLTGTPKENMWFPFLLKHHAFGVTKKFPIFQILLFT